MPSEIQGETKYGEDFLVENLSVSHSPIRFVIDFVRNTPRVDGSTHTTKMLSSHSVVMLDPYLAKEFLSVLSENIRKYEKKFGKIEKPEALRKFEEETNKAGKKTVKQDYFG